MGGTQLKQKLNIALQALIVIERQAKDAWAIIDEVQEEIERLTTTIDVMRSEAKVPEDIPF